MNEQLFPNTDKNRDFAHCEYQLRTSPDPPVYPGALVGYCTLPRGGHVPVTWIDAGEGEAVGQHWGCLCEKGHASLSVA